jgi:glutathione S-transferase
VLKIWGRLTSINVRKVVWTARELGLPFERTDAGREFGIVRTPAYLARNPNGLVPLIDDDGFVLWESNVIVRYLCARHSTGALYPADLQARFDAERWMDWQQTTVNPAGRGAFVQLVRTPVAERNLQEVGASIGAMEPLLEALDARLRARPYVGGERFTMADIPLGCEAHRWFGLPLARKPFPELERWYASLLARPATDGVLTLPLG